MHREGLPGTGLPAEKTFSGESLVPHVVPIKKLVEATGALTLFDYGSGKGQQYRPRAVAIEGYEPAESIADFWGVDDLRCYDPAYGPYSEYPEGAFDGVISTDVLEHCPEEDLPWIVAELFAKAHRFVFANVAAYPAGKTLPSGENAHATIRPTDWWAALFSRAAMNHPGVLWELRVSERHAQAGRAERVVRDGTERAQSARSLFGPPMVVALEGRAMRFCGDNELLRWRAATLLEKERITIEWIRGFEPGAAFLDVGANVGGYTVLAACLRDARVIAFEPEAQNYAVLNRNLALNDLDRKVLAVCAALSDRSSLDRLYLSAQGAGGSCHTFGAELGFDLMPRPSAFSQGCTAFRLDELVLLGQVPVPRYIKIDVDGLELRVIKGMTETLRDPKVRELLVELNPVLTEHHAAREALQSLGFRFDPAQVERSMRRGGPFVGFAEHVFRR